MTRADALPVDVLENRTRNRSHNVDSERNANDSTSHRSETRSGERTPDTMTTTNIIDEVRAFSTDAVTVTCEQKGSRLYVRMRDKAAARMAAKAPKGSLRFLKIDSDECRTLTAACAQQNALLVSIVAALRGRFVANRDGFRGAARNLYCFFDAA